MKEILKRFEKETNIPFDKASSFSKYTLFHRTSSSKPINLSIVKELKSLAYANEPDDIVTFIYFCHIYNVKCTRQQLNWFDSTIIDNLIKKGTIKNNKNIYYLSDNILKDFQKEDTSFPNAIEELYLSKFTFSLVNLNSDKMPFFGKGGWSKLFTKPSESSTFICKYLYDRWVLRNSIYDRGDETLSEFFED